jgi:hypothetical protein
MVSSLRLLKVRTNAKSRAKGILRRREVSFYVLLLAGNVAIVGVLDLAWAQRYVVFCFSKTLRSIFFEYLRTQNAGLSLFVCFCLAAGVSLARQKFGLG